MAKNSSGRLKLLLWLLPIPIFWAIFTEADFAKTFSQPILNMAMDWRFQVRGPLEVPEVKVVYVDIDAETISKIGERPWSRLRFGQVADALFEYGNARAVGFDLIFSGFSSSELVPAENVRGSDFQFREILSEHPNIVLAANYTEVPLPLTFEQRKKRKEGIAVDRALRRMPLKHYQRKLGDRYPYTAESTFPEMPTFPLIKASTGSQGIGLITEDKILSGDTVPRWIPLYANANGPYYTYNLLEGFASFYELDPLVNFYEISAEEAAGMKEFMNLPDEVLKAEDSVQLFDNEGKSMGYLPLNTEQTFLHFSIEMARKYLGIQQEDVTITEDQITLKNPDGNDIIIPMVFNQIMEVNWFSKWQDNELNPRTSVATVLDAIYMQSKGTDEQVKEAEEYFKMFNDAIILIGPTDTTLQDLAPTPFETVPVPKVGMHGNAIKTIFSGKFITRLPIWNHVIVLFALTYFVAALGTYSGRNSAVAKLGSGLLLVGYVILVFTAFSTLHLVLPLVGPVASAITTTLAGAVYQLIVEEKQRGRIKGMFGAYLSPDLVNNMVESGEEPKLGGENVEITAFFSDIQAFSTFSEMLEADRLVALMNEYLTAMTDILQEEDGTLDKYIGDAMVAMFNAPINVEKHALRACVAAARMQKKQLELRAKWESEGDDWPPVVSKMQTRIGLNTGNATVGNMGSLNRFNYTMMGDTVNLAARSESGAKSYGVYIMVTGETMAAATAAGDACVFRYLDKIRVKGRSQPAEMYELVCLRIDLDDETKRCLAIYQEGIECYFKQDFDGAIAKFEQSVELEPNRPEKNSEAPTTPSDVLLARCLYYLEEPPSKNWDGVFVMKTK
ncbi:MAG: adenylate/guanylate cyclase domain-containing protein [Verrucomicrobiota bacterium]